MLFASSRDALKRALTGIAVEVQGTDYSEVAYESGESSFTDWVKITLETDMTFFSLGQGQPWSLISNSVPLLHLSMFSFSSRFLLKNPFDFQVGDWRISPCLSTLETCRTGKV